MRKQRQLGMVFESRAGAAVAARGPALVLPFAILLFASAMWLRDDVAADVSADALVEADATVRHLPVFANLFVPLHGLPRLTLPWESAPPPGRAAAADAVPVQPVSRPPLRLTPEQQKITTFVAKKYRIAVNDVQHLVAHAYRAAREFRLDPYLVLAVMSIESSFNPDARSPAGAQGLMQVLTRVHADKFAPFGGASAAFDPLANISVGARILKEYLVREGSVEGALKSYVGAALHEHDSGYGYKVLSERERIAAAASGRPIPSLPSKPPLAEAGAIVPAVMRQPERPDLPAGNVHETLPGDAAGAVPSAVPMFDAAIGLPVAPVAPEAGEPRVRTRPEFAAIPG